MSAVLDALSLKIQRILADAFNNVRVGNDGAYALQNESTMVIVNPRQQEDGRLLVDVVALMNQAIPSSPELMQWIAENTDNYIFGHIGMGKSDDGKVNLVFRHTLLGSYLDPDELTETVAAVAITANRLDDEVQQRFGGERFVD